MEVSNALRMAEREASISTTNGFFSLLCDTRLLRSNSLLLYSLICVAMPGLSMPELAGSN